jgi:hypothetical protein
MAGPPKAVVPNLRKAQKSPAVLGIGWAWGDGVDFRLERLIPIKARFQALEQRGLAGTAAGRACSLAPLKAAKFKASS